MKSIYSQIEGTADLYAPSVYALLPLFRDFIREADPTSADFVPLTAARLTNVERHKIFVIGILPPTVEVTGRLLDRGAKLGGSEADIAAENAGSTAPLEQPSKFTPGGSDCAATVLEAQAAGKQTEESHLAFMAGPDDYVNGDLNPFTREYFTGAISGGEGRTHCCATVCAAWRKCGLNDPAFSRSATSYKVISDGRMITDPRNDFGGCMFQAVAARAGAWVPGSDQNAFPVRGSAVIAHRYKVVPLFPDKEVGQHAFTITKSDGGSQTESMDGGTFKSGVMGSNQRWWFESGWWRVQDKYGHLRRVEGWSDPAKLPFGDDGSVQPDANSGNFKTDGSDAAQDAAKQIDTAAGKDPRQGSTGETYEEAQKRMINATLEALERIRNTPPLKLLVNPTSFKVGSEKIISDGNRSRSGHIIEHWGEQQDKIEGSGKLAGFFSLDFGGSSTGPGLTRTARQYSASYQNFLSLFQLYKSNGGLWLQDFFDARMDPDARNLSVLGSIYIYYDNILYIGSFDNLTANETDTAPYTLEYSFTFSVRASFLLDRELENSAQTYGFKLATTGVQASPPTTIQELEALHEANMADDAAEARIESAKNAADQLFEPPKPPEPSQGDNAVVQGKGSKTKSIGH